MPIYNAGKYLRLAVLSIVKQTFTNWELFIIDDGSTDNALQDIADIDDARIWILHDGENKGLAARLNECIDLAHGAYFARMDQDDVSHPERFARQIAVLQNDPRLDLIATRAITINENDKVTGLFPSLISHEKICARPWLGFYLPHPTWMGRIEWLRKHRYTVPAPYLCEDQELLLRSYRDSRFGTVDEILFAYRIRSQVNGQKLAKTRRSVFLMQLRHFSHWNQWHFALLATAMLFGRLIGDALKKMGRSPEQCRPDIVGDGIALEWQKIMNGLATQSKVP